MFKSLKGDEEGKKELNKQLAVFEKHLKENKKHIGGEL